MPKSIKSYAITLQIRDEDNIVVDATTINLSPDHASNIIDIASDLILTWRAGESLDQHLVDLEDHCEKANIITNEKSERDGDPNQQPSRPPVPVLTIDELHAIAHPYVEQASNLIEYVAADAIKQLLDNWIAHYNTVGEQWTKDVNTDLPEVITILAAFQKAVFSPAPKPDATVES